MRRTAKCVTLWSFVACALVLNLAGSVAAQDDALAKQILATAGVKAGLCVHIGSGQEKSPGLTAGLAANSGLLVHGLALDDAALRRARKAVEDKKVLGQAIVEKLPAGPLPHVRDLVNLVVIEDAGVLATSALSLAEVNCIVAPGGVICMRKDGRWTKTVKPRPPEMDDWTHPKHGPGNNMVSADRLVQFPVGLRWLDGVPMNFNLWAACRGWVIADGRCFTLSTTELENLGPACFTKHKQEEYVTARDAFNGLPLWKVNCETLNDGRYLNARNIAPLVTDGRRVYVYKKDKLVGLDAATGQVATSYAVKFPPVRLLLSQQVLLAAGWEGKEEGKGMGGEGVWAPWVGKTAAGAVEAFDVASGKPKWSLPVPAQEIVAADGAAYLLLQTGNPAQEHEIVAVDLQTGKERWRASHTQFSPGEPPLHIGYAGSGVVVVARLKAKAISVLAAADGKPLWEIPRTDQFWTPVVDGLLWHGNKKYDPQTGEVKGTLTSGINSPVCTPSAVVGSYVTASRGSAYVDLGSSDGAKPAKGAKYITYRGVRGGCIEGAVPAHGMFYTSQNNCRCAPGQVPGFVAFGPNGDLPTPEDFEKARPVEKGPAFGSLTPAAVSDGSWPTFRYDASRGGVTKTRLPEKLKIVWQSDAAQPADGPLAAVWNARVSSCLSAPTAAEGRVFAAAVDAGQIVALDAASGKPLWRFTAGGRIDTPPTIYRELCLFGCHDGWVYALRANDGQLAWRTRIAPWERRLVAFGQVESVWPAIGSVLVHDGVAYASAGRTSESDGGVAVSALNPATGEQLWGKVVGPGPLRENDLLLLSDDKVALHAVAFDPKSGQVQAGSKPPVDSGLEGFCDGTWTRIGNRRSGDMKFGKVGADMFVWTAETVYGYECRSRQCFAIARAKTAGNEKDPKDRAKPEDYAWRMSSLPNHQVEAMAICGSGLAVAGRVVDPKSEKLGGFLWIVSLTDGKRVAEHALAAPPAFSGLAIANERVYVALQNGQIACFGKAE